MKILINGSGQICAASNFELEAPQSFSVVEVPGDAETYAWPNGSPVRCLWQGGAIVANPNFSAQGSVDDKEAIARSALDGSPVSIDLLKLMKAKVISDEAYRLNKAPGALTGAELLAIRNRIANIYKAL